MFGELPAHTACAAKQILTSDLETVDDLAVSGLLTGYGEIDSFDGDQVSFRMGHFVPFSGIVIPQDQAVWKTKLPTNIRWMTCGMKFGFKEAMVDRPGRLVDLEKATATWVIPEFKADCPFEFYHLFSGAFCGWSKAVDWLDDPLYKNVCVPLMSMRLLCNVGLPKIMLI